MATHSAVCHVAAAYHVPSSTPRITQWLMHSGATDWAEAVCNVGDDSRGLVHAAGPHRLVVRTRVVAATTQVQILVRTGTALDTLHGVLR